MAKQKSGKVVRQQGVEPRVQTAEGWVRQMRREHGEQKLKKGYDAKVVE